MALIHGRSAEGEEVKSTNPVLIGAKDINGNAILLTTDAEGKLRVATDLEIASVTATDVTIHDPTTPGNKLKINADGSLPVQLSGSKKQLLKSYIGDTHNIYVGVKTIYFGSTYNIYGVAPIPLDISQYSNVAIKIKNSYDVAAFITIYYMEDLTSSPAQLEKLISNESLAAGATKVWSINNTPKLADVPGIGLLVAVYTDTATSGSLDLKVFGGATR